MRELCLFRCEGKPIQEGSLNVSRTGHLYHAKGAALTSYRSALAASARLCLPEGYVPIDGPMRVTALFSVAVRDEKKWGQAKTSAPDLDKYTRSVGDALTKVVWSDDSRIVQWHTAKIFGAEDFTIVRVELLSSEDAEELATWVRLTKV